MAKKTIKKVIEKRLQGAIGFKGVNLILAAKCGYCGKTDLESEVVFCDDYCKDTFVAKS